jgi:hypothetical protein
MNKLLKISFLLLLLMPACSPHFQRPVMDDRTQLAVPEKVEKGIRALEYHSGKLEDFSYENSRWSTWSNSLEISHEKNVLKIEAKKAGSDYSNVSFKFPIIDFTETPVIKITAYTEGGSTPVIKVVLKDANGNEANESAPTDTVKGSESKNYYFNFKGKWRQNWPASRKVDSSAISEMLIYINSGGPDYSGMIYLDEVSAIREEDAPKKVVIAKTIKKQNSPSKEDSLKEIPEPNVFYSYKQVLDSWWSDKKMTLSKKDSAMIVTAYEVGPKYEVLGKSFKPMDFRNTGVIRIRARAESASRPSVSLSVTDKKGHGTNFEPDTAVITNEDGYKDYYFNFNGKYKQVWPDTAKVNPREIVSLSLFINAGKESYTGKIYIKDVRVIEESDMPDEEVERISMLKKSKSAPPPVVIEKTLETGMLYKHDDSIETWWADKKIIMLKKNNDMAIIGYDLGPKYEVFGKTFKPMDFTNSGVIRIRAKAESSTMPILSISLTDKEGHGANFQPQTEKITNGKGYKDYYFNFKGKYKQVWPKTAKVNSAEIISVILFINAGKTPFTGTLLINEVEVMTESQAKKKRSETEK